MPTPYPQFARRAAALPTAAGLGGLLLPGQAAADIDHILRSAIATVTDGISPASLALAYADWALHLAAAPGKLLTLAQQALRKDLRLASYALYMGCGLRSAPCIEPQPPDRRFAHPLWQQWPFNLYCQSFLLNQQWWQAATTGISGVSPRHQQMVSFVARQLLDLGSPANFVATNPEALDTTLRQNGQNFVRGAINLLNEAERKARRLPPPGGERFVPGKQVALTRGKVVFRNRLFELLQYTPLTDQVLAEPVLMVPGLIMKYYLLDLSRHNSLVRYLVGRGHTVFMMSWHNPDAADRGLDFDDYLWSGLMNAVDSVHAIVPGASINAVGYSLGGTLLAAASAYLGAGAGSGQRAQFNSLTLLAAQTDFSEPGELSLLTDDSQAALVDKLVRERGYLDPGQAASTPLPLLQSQDLAWSRQVHDYLSGRRAPMTDLAAWNADAMRLPGRLHSDCLRRLFLDNALAAGRLLVGGRPVALRDIGIPIFAVAAERDHVAPWRSVYQVMLLAGTEVSFVLCNGGHHDAIVSEPDHPGRHFRHRHHLAGDPHLDPERWLSDTPPVSGSWWPGWSDWLGRHSADGLVHPPSMGRWRPGDAALVPAPGMYVHEK